MKPIVLLSILIILFSCSNPEKKKEAYNPKGIGPIQQLELATINDSLMNVGQSLFKQECSTCHIMEFKGTGPDISDILTYRDPEWVMNFILNKEEMLAKDSLAQITNLHFNEPCSANITTEKEAREILEYLRQYQIWLHEFNVK